MGVDLNRNWPAPGFTIGASDNPCSDVFHGGEAGTQPEVRVAHENLLQRKDRVMVSMSVHSYGEQV